MQKTIKYSIIVATKNRYYDLNDLLISFKENLLLDRRDVEVIIIDNGSRTKNIYDLCNHFGVKYLLENTGGKSRALNKGIKKSRGIFAVFTDDDVIIKDKYWLEKLSQHFLEYPNLGYVSGNIIGLKLTSKAQKMWEKKGGLSKGNRDKYFPKKDFNKKNLKPWPLTKFCAGANCMIPRKILKKVGGYCEYFGPGAPIGHGESLEIGYRIIKAGYELYYDSKATIFHKHPKTEREIKEKLKLYGIGDTAIHMYLFLKYKDLRSLFWSLGGHQLYLIGNMLKSIMGQYPLRIDYIMYSLAGSSLGGITFLFILLREKLENIINKK